MFFFLLSLISFNLIQAHLISLGLPYSVNIVVSILLSFTVTSASFNLISFHQKGYLRISNKTLT